MTFVQSLSREVMHNEQKFVLKILFKGGLTRITNNNHINRFISSITLSAGWVFLASGFKELDYNPLIFFPSTFGLLLGQAAYKFSQLFSLIVD